MLVCWADGTNDSQIYCMMFQSSHARGQRFEPRRWQYFKLLLDLRDFHSNPSRLLSFNKSETVLWTIPKLLLLLLLWIYRQNSELLTMVDGLSSLHTDDVFGSFQTKKAQENTYPYFHGSLLVANKDMADYYLLSIENIQLLCYLYLCLNWISVFFRSHTGNWSLLNEDCYSAQINGVQTKSTLRVSVTRFNLKYGIK